MTNLNESEVKHEIKLIIKKHPVNGSVSELVVNILKFLKNNVVIKFHD